VNSLDYFAEEKRLEREARKQREGEQRAAVTQGVDRWVRLLNDDRKEIDHDALRTFQDAIQFDDLFSELSRAIVARRYREEEARRLEFEAEREAARAEFQNGLPARIEAVRKVLEGDVFDEGTKGEYIVLQSCAELSETEKGAMKDLWAAFSKRVNKRLERERREAELAEQARTEREEREREAAWRALPREVRAGYVFVQSLPSELRPAFKALIAVLHDKRFDPLQVPADWQPHAHPSAAELVARIPRELPFARPAKPPEREPENHTFGRAFLRP
jgi:hypothetical protein